MRQVLIACEESQIVTMLFRNIGIECYSCDIQSCSGGRPEWHIKQDVLTVLQHPWSMVIAFPPCTHLASSGARWFSQKRADGRQAWGINFFMEFVKCNAPLIAIENPIGIMSTVYRKPDQIIQPWQFGHGETKATCLWLKGLPKLMPTNIVEGRLHKIHNMAPSKDRAKIRSKTYEGIAKAMVAQWCEFL